MTIFTRPNHHEVTTMNYNLTTNRTFGVELEGFGLARTTVVDLLLRAGISNVCQSYYSDHGQTNMWKIKTDASIQGHLGFEVVSPILQGNEGLAELEKVMTILEDAGAQVNRSCGVHVHWGVRDWGMPQFRNLFARYVKYEEAINSFLPRSRHNGTYCRSLNTFADTNTPKTSTELKWNSWKQVKTLRQFRDYFHANRYYKLNLMSYWAHGTIEFRQHSGSFNFEKVCRWIEFTGAMIAQVDNKVRVKNWRSDEPTKAEQLDTMLDNMVANEVLSNETARFLRGRQRQFAA